MKEHFVYCNPHPQEKIVGDCVKRAICLAEGRDYKEVSLELNRLKKVTGAKNFNSNNNWKYYVESKEYTKYSFPAERGCSRMDGYEFTKKFPKGTYILRMAHHLTCCRDGVIYDTWDCRSKCVYNAFKVKEVL